MKKILLIATGGTIASLQTDTGLSPKLASDSLLAEVPEISEFCSVSAVQLYRLDSTNMRPMHWLELARLIRKEYENYDGFVVTHGTDTMAYASSMLYYLIQNSRKPIVLTGSQQSISERNTDARENLLSAFRYACDDGSSGVRIVFDGKVISGTRARKNRTKSYNAFSSVDYPEVAVIRGGKVRHYIKENAVGEPIFYDEIDIGTTGTDCDPSYISRIYNDGDRITRGAARIVYTRYDANRSEIIDPNEKYVFYTYNHYNDFQEYLNYEGGWGKMFGNITGGGTISSKVYYNPTPYVSVVRKDLSVGKKTFKIYYFFEEKRYVSPICFKQAA